MAFIPLPEGVKIEIKYRKNGSVVLNVMWGRVTVEVDSDLLGTIGGTIAAWWTATRDDQCASSIALEEVIVTDWSVEDGLQATYIVSPPTPGTNAGADMPSNVAQVVTLYTGYAGRSFRGRQYWCGLPDTAFTGNVIGTASVAAMVSDMGTLISDLQAVGCNIGVASFRHNNAPRTTGIITEVRDWGADNVVDTQRRRIPQTFG